MQALLSTSNAILSTCQRTFPAFCRAASLSPHTLLSASLCPTFFQIVFFVSFLHSASLRRPLLLSLGLFPGHKDSSMTSLLEQTVAQPTQSKVCAINGTSKVIFYVGPEFKLLQTINLSKHGSTNTSCSPNLK